MSSNLPPDAWRIELAICDAPERCDDDGPLAEALSDLDDDLDDEPHDAEGVPVRLNRLIACGICGQQMRLRSLVKVRHRRTGEQLFVCGAECLKEARSN